MELLPDAVLIADRLVIFDNSRPGYYRGMMPRHGSQHGLRPIVDVRLAPPIVDIEYRGMRCDWVDRHLIVPPLARDQEHRLGDGLETAHIRWG